MTAGLGVAVHVGHFAGEAAIEPVAQPIEAVGRPHGGDPDEIEAERAGVLLQAALQRFHASMLPRTKEKEPRNTRKTRKKSCSSRFSVSSVCSVVAFEEKTQLCHFPETGWADRMGYP